MPTTLFRLAATAALALVTVSACAEEDYVEPAASPEKIEEYIAWLADDAREGREAGTPGYDAAADYVAQQFEALGLEPAGEEGSWMQPVPLRAVSRDLEAQGLSLSVEGETVEFEPMVDFLMGASARYDNVALTAPAVFVGYGLQVPEHGFTDFDGVDVEGKIVVALSGIPSGMPSEEAAHYSATKRAMASDLGAVGYITVPTEASAARRPFARTIAGAGRAGVTWIGKDGEGFSETPSIRAAATMSAEGAEKLFAAAGQSWEEIRAAADAGTHPAGFDFAGAITMEAASTYEDQMSANVAGMIRGSDPELADEYVVLTAHLDHIGVRESIDPEKDNINNGALDNATGVAILLEEARLFQEAIERGRPPRRSVIFLAVTAEEKGLLGAEYFAYNPTVPIGDIVANVNLDMPLITFDFVDVIAFGAEHSSLGATVNAAAESMDVALIPDPVPEMSIFTRSDHYRFVQQGIPSVFLFLGFGNGGEEVFRDFMANRYHQPGDEIDQGLDFEAGAKFATLNYRIAREIADADARPAWNEGNLFGKFFAGDE